MKYWLHLLHFACGVKIKKKKTKPFIMSRVGGVTKNQI